MKEETGTDAAAGELNVVHQRYRISISISLSLRRVHGSCKPGTSSASPSQVLFCVGNLRPKRGESSSAGSTNPLLLESTCVCVALLFHQRFAACCPPSTSSRSCPHVPDGDHARLGFAVAAVIVVVVNAGEKDDLTSQKEYLELTGKCEFAQCPVKRVKQTSDAFRLQESRLGLCHERWTPRHTTHAGQFSFFLL